MKGTPSVMRPRKRFSASTSRVHGEVQRDRAGAWEAVYRLVRRIPKGKVMTYGQIATLTESRLSPRAVGWAMHGCPKGVPWQRVVNASGGCSTDRLTDMPAGLQRILLEAEGIRFRADGTLDLERYRWVPSVSVSGAARAGGSSPSGRRVISKRRHR
jgi:methylated-DNA-protein-cysteine methyltransferase-like protein